MSIRKEFECVDIFGHKVSCSKKRWKHICEHAEMVGLQKLVKSIITKPDFICRSRSYANRHTFYKKCWLSQLGRDVRHIRIVIEYQIDSKQNVYGSVMSAMACGGMQYGEVVIWQGIPI